MRIGDRILINGKPGTIADMWPGSERIRVYLDTGDGEATTHDIRDVVIPYKGYHITPWGVIGDDIYHVRDAHGMRCFTAWSFVAAKARINRILEEV